MHPGKVEFVTAQVSYDDRSKGELQQEIRTRDGERNSKRKTDPAWLVENDNLV
jgi:hypothetical protein